MTTRLIIKTMTVVFALIGFISVLLLCIGFIMDFRSFDQTQGGYEPPYTDFTGQPIRWHGIAITARPSADGWRKISTARQSS